MPACSVWVFRSGRRYEVGIALPPPLGCEEIVVPASPAVRVTTADRRANVIDSALTFLCIEKLTHMLEDVVFLVSQYPALGRSLRVASLGLLVGNAKMLRDSQEVTLGHFDAIITATIGRTLRTVVHHRQRT